MHSTKLLKAKSIISKVKPFFFGFMIKIIFSDDETPF